MVATRIKNAFGAAGLKARFAAAGLLNTAFGLSVFPALLLVFGRFGLQYEAALLISQLLCISFAYVTMRGAFRARGYHLGQVSRFSAFYVLGAGFNFLALPFCVEILGLRAIPAQFGLSLVTIAASYLWHSRITFQPGSPKP